MTAKGRWMMNKQETMEKGKDLFCQVWYRKWELLHRGWDLLLKGIVAFAFLSSILMLGISAWDSITAPENGTAVEDYEEPDALIWKSIVGLNQKTGNVVYIGMTISKEKAIKLAQENANNFNHQVAEKRADFEAGITAKIPKAFRTPVDVYWCPKENALFIVPRGMKVDAEYEKIQLDE